MRWQELLESCVSETDTARLGKLVYELEDAIYLRFRELSTEPYLSDESRALKQAAQTLLELKTEKLGWPDFFKTNGELTDSHKPTVTLAGTVEKIIPAVHGHPEKVQISVEGADDLYREIRIENALQDGDGKPIALKQGTDVDVTIEADHTDTKPKE